jgi:hypothetical protein
MDADFDLGKDEFDFRMFTRLYIGEIKIHFAFMEKDINRNIKLEINILKKEFKEKYKKIDKFQLDKIIEEANNVFYALYARYSFITLLCTSIEKQLKQYCYFIQLECNYPISLEQIRAFGIIERAEIYLKQDRSNRKSINWKFIKDLFLIRNCIVHSLGIIEFASKDERVKKSRKAINENLRNGLSIIDREGNVGTLVISPDYCSIAIREMTDFFNSLFACSDDLF